ncbi:hypothetical protein RHSIM_RhsimUnG0118300 [Rhododendron simsii]|uniref:DUF4220 domain-containing protein n=1 Tax=Rhododendron simsii TaxID=118357 RepID=A0A834L4T4_RHOSS|nr:hypothetical protein RHSIM_RhsimUnG0118300 [Rhododendron simsii]
MDPIPAWMKRFWDVWDLRLLVLLSLVLQIILSLFGNRRKYISSPWFSLLIWSAYLMADWAATVALGKLSDAENDNALKAIWAPLLLVHLGGPDTITAYSLEDNQLWKRHLLGLVVQFSVAVYVTLMSWKHSWFSIMSIPALVAGFIKYGERTWVLMSVSRDQSGKLVPFFNAGEERTNLGNNNTSEDKNSMVVLCVAHSSVRVFKNFMELYDVGEVSYSRGNPVEFGDIHLFWNVIEVEMGLMFDLLYTKVPINFSKGGWILRCITFSCTVTVLIGSILQLISTGEERDKWHKVDIAITEVLLVGALALEIYAIISLYLFSDWATIWLTKHNRGKQIIQLRGKISRLFFLPKRYRCRMVGQFDLLDFWLNNKPEQKVGRRILWSLLGIKTWVEECFGHWWVEEYIKDKTAVIVPSLLFDPVYHCCLRLTSRNRHPGRAVEEDPVWREFFHWSLDVQIISLHIATEICYNLEMEWATPDASDQNDRDSTTVSQHHMMQNRELCRTLSRYMMYLFVMRTSLLPIAASGDLVSEGIRNSPLDIEGAQDVRAACRSLLESNAFGTRKILGLVRSKQEDERWEMLKLMWVRMLCNAASKGQRTEHLRQLSQGGEFLTFLWFFLPQSRVVRTAMELVR